MAEEWSSAETLAHRQIALTEAAAMEVLHPVQNLNSSTQARASRAAAQTHRYFVTPYVTSDALKIEKRKP
jgi:hypothetical protein